MLANEMAEESDEPIERPTRVVTAAACPAQTVKERHEALGLEGRVFMMCKERQPCDPTNVREWEVNLDCNNPVFSRYGNLNPTHPGRHVVVVSHERLSGMHRDVRDLDLTGLFARD